MLSTPDYKRRAQLTSNAGDIISLNVAGQIIVILNSSKITKELLEKRGAFYSDRPLVPILEKYVQ